MVAVDDQRKPTAVSPIQPSTEVEKRRHAAAVVRKKLRQEFSEQFNQLKVQPDIG
jgi:acyl-CoA hydrolase